MLSEGKQKKETEERKDYGQTTDSIPVVSLLLSLPSFQRSENMLRRTEPARPGIFKVVMETKSGSTTLRIFLHCVKIPGVRIVLRIVIM